MKKKIIIVNLGSSVIAPSGRLDVRLIARLLGDVVSVEKKGYHIIVVSSGAIACGMERLGFKRRPQDTYALMAISSLGQIILMDKFNTKLKKHNRLCAQVLLTWDDFNHRQRFMNIRKTIDKLLAMNVIPVINENDAVSYEEIGFGDNDRLSSLVADLMSAEQLIILSDVEGLLDGDSVVKEVRQIDDKIKSLIKQKKKTHTKGGMAAKLEAAALANISGIKTILAHGKTPHVIARIIDGESIGTSFKPSERKEKSRKRWIRSKKIKGRIWIDDGAKEALLNRGRSLLSVGITRTSEGFHKGDAVMVLDERGDVLGCGLANYGADIFGGATKKRLEKEVIHRDNFVRTVEEWHFHPDVMRKKT